jgi:hypothetical protein
MTQLEYDIVINVLEEELKFLRNYVEENNIKDFVVCIGNRAYFNVK